MEPTSFRHTTICEGHRGKNDCLGNLTSVQKALQPWKGLNFLIIRQESPGFISIEQPIQIVPLHTEEAYHEENFPHSLQSFQLLSRMMSAADIHECGL
jgi:hypothetical protein